MSEPAYDASDMNNEPYETLRDRFAMAALTGLLATQSEANGYYKTTDKAVQEAFGFADAMMKERAKP